MRPCRWASNRPFSIEVTSIDQTPLERMLSKRLPAKERIARAQIERGGATTEKNTLLGGAARDTPAEAASFVERTSLDGRFVRARQCRAGARSVILFERLLESVRIASQPQIAKA